MSFECSQITRISHGVFAIAAMFLAGLCWAGPGGAKEHGGTGVRSAGQTRPAGSIRGKIVFLGKAPAPVKLPMASDPKCREQHRSGFQFQPVVLGGHAELADVFVYVKRGLEGRTFEPPKEVRVILDQKGCWYSPRVTGAMVGQMVAILNSDATIHNVNALPEFNASMPAGVKRIEKVFTRPEVMKRIKCNVHPWMTAYVGILEHSFYGVTDKNGAYAIKGLASGKYLIEAWHERLGVVSKEVVVGTGAAVVDFKFSATASIGTKG